MPLASEALAHWQEHRWLLLPNYVQNVHALETWVDDLAERAETAGQWMKYFEPGPAGERQLCRVENFLEYHAPFDDLVNGEAMLALIGELLGEEATLFKEKINFKLAGGAGFTAHQDAPAFTSFAQSIHITAMLSVDATTPVNGCLEIAAHPGSSTMLPMTQALTIEPSVVDELEWTIVPTQPGDLLLFDSFLPHRSGINRTDTARRAAYVTYAKANEGDHRQAYYREKRAVFPPDIEREPGRDYGAAGVFNVGNPIR